MSCTRYNLYLHTSSVRLDPKIPIFKHFGTEFLHTVIKYSPLNHMQFETRSIKLILDRCFYLCERVFKDSQSTE